MDPRVPLRYPLITDREDWSANELRRAIAEAEALLARLPGGGGDPRLSVLRCLVEQDLVSKRHLLGHLVGA